LLLSKHVDLPWFLQQLHSTILAKHLAHNDLVGTLPGEVKHLDWMEVMNFNHNPDLIGTIPQGPSGMLNLRHLALQWCGFSGEVPTWIGTMTTLKFLGLGNNMFEGSIPSKIRQLTNLHLLGLDDNVDLTGNIEGFHSLSNLRSFYLEDNQFTGTISKALMASWPKLQELDISGNILSGKLPDSFFNHEMPLVVLDLHGNEFSGRLPSNTRESNVLEFLALYSNNFEGEIATDYFLKFKALRHLDISHNRFGGEFPDLGSMKKLEYLFLGGNGFVPGPVPSWLVQLTNLRELTLKGNHHSSRNFF
jgi:LRR receptor-like serine/threonine-protein kinase FLS2